MNFKHLNLKIKYRSSEDNIVKDFFIPVLKCAHLYKRAVGFFSSTALIEVSRGISGLIENDGKIFLIASPILQEKDIEAINKGYEERDKIIEKVILDSFKDPINYFEEERLNLLAHLIIRGILDIKIAFLEHEKKVGIYHEKIGLIYDTDGNVIAFTGSLNESSNAFTENFESIDVFYSWKGDDSNERVREKENDFKNLWENRTNKITVIDFPKIAKEKLQTYMKPYVKLDIDAEEYESFYESGKKYTIQKYPKLPIKLKLHDYQSEAVNNWKNQGFKGIFNMATGTGKTYTGLAAITSLYELKHKLAIIVICPFQHLVEQWAEDIQLFNMDPIIGYSTSSQKDWKNKLRNAVIDYNLDIIEYFCFVTTNATYTTDFVQEQISRLHGNVVLVVDEAHNFGALNLSSKLNPKIPYRLALSATLERYRDPEGTKKLYDYFGQECINYSLEKAIRENKLTPYYYYPVLTWLTDDELDAYRQLSIQLAKCFHINENGVKLLNEQGKKIAIKRTRLVAGSINKLPALVEKIDKYKTESHILVYCGATTIADSDYIEGKVDETELRQISIVADLLGNKLNMKVAQFTSQENAQEREILKREFAKGDNLQVLIAIRCLDEGVNIPNIKTAFILASSTNPKEYIQRRGRVLRLAPGKNYALIYDFVTVPRPLEEVKNMPESEIKYDISLIKKEITRIRDFAELSLNPQTGLELINKLSEAYDLDKFSGGDEYGD